ncbi:RES family NAD+ phosphorylase [Microbacterium sp. LEMMJ01]|uniref:RES family NAD+ phosphorylase n=1 Tax=Microbacterium sp. LEMMJ01 TaxID=1978350 RepID=UPI000A1E1B30|nr:RES domain-containing protein [Microbacterium sp. LEMMJ01]OSP08803.1 hypothetical protein B7W94_03990 [Microbacterium sp. LEMMJ01]
MTGLDDDLVQRVDQLPRTVWSADTFRYTGSSRDPLSGAGARLFGGRWNPKDIFATIYLATPVSACMGELARAATSQSAPVEVFLQADYSLHTIAVSEITVLDLRAPAALAHVGLSDGDIRDPDWTACQNIGNAAWFLGFGGILAPSATGDGIVLAAFEARASPHLSIRDTERLTHDLYTRLVGSDEALSKRRG